MAENPENKNPFWDADHLQTSLQSKYEEAIKLGDEISAWYRKKRWGVRRWSQIMRGLAIFMAGMGGIAPLVEATELCKECHFSKWGYIAFAVAATFILFDKFYGLSSGWIRYMLSQMEVDNAIGEFKDTWTMEMVKIGNRELQSKDVVALISEVMNFKARVQGIVRNETESWANEFQSNLAEIQKLVKVEPKARQLGSLKVRVENEDAFDRIIVKLNNGESAQLQGSVAHIPGLAPGEYVVTITGYFGGQEYIESDVAVILEGSMESLNVTLPWPEAEG